MLDSGEAAKNREIQPEATFDLTNNPGSERLDSNPRMQIANKLKHLYTMSVLPLLSKHCVMPVIKI